MRILPLFCHFGVFPLLWRSVDVELVKDDATVAVVTLLRPLWWLEVTGARVGGSIRLEAAEAELSGWARILDIRADVTVDSRRLGPGKAVVIGTIMHRGARVIELVLDGDRSESLGVTPAHPLYSADRQAWVPAGEVQVGEGIETHEGSTATVTEVLDEGRRETVYNLEVHRAQSYYVGPQKLLAHNTGLKCLDARSNSGKFLDPADKSGQLTRAGRALQKHGGRQGSTFPGVKGNASQILSDGSVPESVMTRV